MTDFEEKTADSGEAPTTGPSPTDAPASAATSTGAAATPAGTHAKTGAADKPARKPWLTRVGAIAFVVAFIFLIVVFVWWFFSNSDDFFDDSVQPGQANYKTEEEIQAELNKVVEEGMLNISIASVIEFDSGTSEGIAYIENSPANHYVITVAIALDDTGEVVYQSGGMKPDTYIEKITLSRDLDAGSYPATATFTAYDMNTLEEIGQAAAKVVLAIKS